MSATETRNDTVLHRVQRYFHQPTKLSGLFTLGAELLGEPPPEGALVQRIVVTGAGTLDYLSRGIACAVAREGFWPVIHQSPFGSWVQEALDPGSALHGFEPDLVVIATEWREHVEELPLGLSREEVEAVVARRVALFDQVWTSLQARPGCRIIQHVLQSPQAHYRGVADRATPASHWNQVQMLNQSLIEAGAGRVVWVDMDRLAAVQGGRRWAPARLRFDAKLGFDPRYLPDYLAAFGGAWRSAFGRTRKVLALDLDNTLWGGVIGDDGIEGIVLGPASPEGEAFEAWQGYVKGLSARGVILAACSKNMPEIAEAGLAHPSAQLRRADFAAFQCSWNDKAEGLRTIARELNVGLDSIAFVDDNPAECALVRQMLPEVATLCLGDDPATFIGLLDDQHWFDAQRFTIEDGARAQAYAARNQATAARASAASLDTYLQDLGMVGHVAPATEADMPRLAQLEQKTNQFNTMTRRLAEAELRAYAARDDAVVLAFRLADRFGDHGLVSSLVAVRHEGRLRIESWLMSCRVFSRTAEPFIMAALLAEAHARGLGTIEGRYEPTAKNGVVADLWARLGFAEVDGTWCLAVDSPGVAAVRTFITAAA